MYRVSVPIMLNPRFEKDFDEFMAQSQQAKVDRVFLCAAMSVAPEAHKQEHLRLLRKYLPKVREAGFDVAVWTNSLGHGSALQHEDSSDSAKTDTRLMMNLDGQYMGYSYCPLHEEFSDNFARWLQDIARTGARTIMLDDDYRVSWRSGHRFCACDRHMAKLQEELGEPVTREFVKEMLAKKEPNRYRDAWMKVQGDSLLWLAKKLRAALDEVDPTVRLGHCAVLSTWDIDGVDSITLARTFAGQNKPFLRYIGAAYWAGTHGHGNIKLGHVCEYERMQQEWCKNSGIETFCEGDTYPRPRQTVPAAYLEGFDTAMRVAGTSDGMLKYMFDYTSSPHFETGYLSAHLRHLPLYEKLHGHFDGKQAVGITVFEPMKKFAQSHCVSTPWEDHGIPAAVRFVADCGLPTRYDAGDEATVVFGDAAELAGDEQFANGAILDVTAAEALTRRGWDVGLDNMGQKVRPGSEYFPAYDEDVGIAGGDWYELAISEQAEALSWLRLPDRRVPAAYYYENAKGQRFLVYAFRAQTGHENSTTDHGVFRSKCRTLQVKDTLPRLMGKAPRVQVGYGLEIYVQAKADEKSISVAVWNFCEDELYDQTVTLPGGKNIDFAAGGGTLENGVVKLDMIQPFGMAAFTVEL